MKLSDIVHKHETYWNDEDQRTRCDCCHHKGSSEFDVEHLLYIESIPAPIYAWLLQHLRVEVNCIRVFDEWSDKNRILDESSAGINTGRKFRVTALISFCNVCWHEFLIDMKDM